MTNKEKARDIAGGLNFPISSYEAGEYDGAIEMAKWKDQQFKELLNTLCEWWESDKPKSVINYNDCEQFRKYAESIVLK